MKVLLKSLLLALLFAAVWIHGETLWSGRLFLDEPRIHVIQDGEFLSKIAQMYYGRASYWRVLALINRAPNPDRIYPGEQIILPDQQSVARLARARRLSEVNALTAEQEQLAKLESDDELIQFQTGRSPNLAQNEPAPLPVEEKASPPAPAAATPVKAESPAQLNPPAAAEPLPQTETKPPASAQQPRQKRSLMWPLIIVAVLLLGGGYFWFLRRSGERGFEEEEESSVWETLDRSGEAEAAEDAEAETQSEKKEKHLLLQ